MNTNDFLELTHPVAVLLLGIAFGLLIVIIMLAYTILSAMDIYRERYMKNALLAVTLVPGMPDYALYIMMSVIITEIIVILVLLQVLRSLTGLRVQSKAWAVSFIVAGSWPVTCGRSSSPRQSPPLCRRKPLCGSTGR